MIQEVDTSYTPHLVKFKTTSPGGGTSGMIEGFAGSSMKDVDISIHRAYMQPIHMNLDEALQIRAIVEDLILAWKV